MCQICSKVGHIASQCYQLRDFFGLGKGGSLLVAMVVEVSEKDQGRQRLGS